MTGNYREKIATILGFILLFSYLAMAATGVVSHFRIDRGRCIGCGMCVPKCPVNAISLEKGRAVIDSSLCIACGLCSRVCPVGAVDTVYATEEELEVMRGEAANPDSGEVPSPQTAEPLDTIESAKTAEADKPDATSEDSGTAEAEDSAQIVGIEEDSDSEASTADSESISPVPILDREKCISCNRCARICPTGAIEMIDGYPVIDPDKCIMCLRCISRCPTGALSAPEGD